MPVSGQLSKFLPALPKPRSLVLHLKPCVGYVQCREVASHPERRGEVRTVTKLPSEQCTGKE